MTTTKTESAPSQPTQEKRRKPGPKPKSPEDLILDVRKKLGEVLAVLPQIRQGGLAIPDSVDEQLRQIADSLVDTLKFGAN